MQKSDKKPFNKLFACIYESHKAFDMRDSLLITVFIFALLPLYGQASSHLKQAELLFESQEYEKIVNLLSPKLDKPAQFSEKELIKAYFLRGQAYTRITGDAFLLGKYQEAFFLAYDDLQKVISLDQKGNYQARAFALIQSMRTAITENALRKVNEANLPNLKLEQAKEIAEVAIKFTRILIDIEPQNYIYYDLRGQAQLARRDSLPATMDFQTAIRLYKDSPPEKPDFLIAYAYYRTALVQRLSLAYQEQAIQTIKAGQRFIKQEWNRANQSDSRQRERYQTALKDLDTYELDILYNNPAYQEQAIHKFATFLEDNPNNYRFRCAYASLIEVSNTNEAIAQYRKAIVIDPDQKLAYFNLAALYINQSVKELKKNAKAGLEEAEKKANQIAQKAVPFLEQAHRIDPLDLQVINQLMTIHLRNNELEKFQFYKAKRDQLVNK